MHSVKDEAQEKRLQRLRACREKLQDLTPLKRDCGRVCGAACCRSLPGEETGMLLFPGEEAFYADDPAFRIVEGAAGKILVCEGRCEREKRPLACRLFPLLPLEDEDGQMAARMDLRARAVCPLSRDGVDGLRGDFRMVVEEVGRQLMEDDETADFLRLL